MTDEEESRKKSESNDFSLNSSFEFVVDSMGDSFNLMGSAGNASDISLMNEDHEGKSENMSEDVSFTADNLLEASSCLFCSSKYASFEKYSLPKPLLLNLKYLFKQQPDPHANQAFLFYSPGNLLRGWTGRCGCSSFSCFRENLLQLLHEVLFSPSMPTAHCILVSFYF